MIFGREGENVKNVSYSSVKAGRKLGSRFRLDISAYLLLIPSAFCIYFMILRPQVLSIVYSFFNMKGFKVADFAGLDNYRRVFADPVFWKAFGNTWKYIFWSLLLGFPLPFIVAIMLNEIIHFRKTARVLIYLPAILPGVAVSLLWYFMYYPDQSGLLNSILVKFGMEPYLWLQDTKWVIAYIVVSMTWSGFGSTALYYFAGLQGINRELYESAVIDGAGFFRRHWVVTVPQMSGMLFLFAIRQCIAVFNIMDQPMQMTDGGPNNASISLGLLSYRYGFANYQQQLAVALGVIMLLVTIVFAIIYIRLDRRLEENQM